jgi:hypothetical protein
MAPQSGQNAAAAIKLTRTPPPPAHCGVRAVAIIEVAATMGTSHATVSNPPAYALSTDLTSCYLEEATNLS